MKRFSVLLFIVAAGCSQSPGGDKPSTGSAAPAAQTVFISELVVGNDASYCDSFGDDPDWVEIHNPTAAPVDLGGWALTDRPGTEPQRARIPANTIVPPGGYTVIFFRSKNPANRDRTDGKDPHVNFRLKVDGEDLTLVNPRGVEVHRIRFGKQLRDISIGTSGHFEPAVPLKWPTPGLPNDSPQPPNRCPPGHK